MTLATDIFDEWTSNGCFNAAGTTAATKLADGIAVPVAAAIALGGGGGPAAAGTLTGTTLASNVVTSSLTTVGTIGAGVWQGTAIADAYIASAATWNAKAASGANTDITSVALNQTGLTVKGGSVNKLTIKPNETLSAGRTLNLIVNDVDRTINLGGNLTVSSAATISGTNTGDEVDADGTHAGRLTLSAQVMGAGDKRFNDNVGIGVAPTLGDLHIQKSSAAAGTVGLVLRNSQINGLAKIEVLNDTSVGGSIQVLGQNFSSSGRPGINILTLRAESGTNGLAIHCAASNKPIQFWTSIAGVNAMRAEITATGTLQVGAVDVLTQTNSISGITGKTFSGLTHSGTMALGTTTVSGTPTFSGVVTFQGQNVEKGTNSLTAFATGGQASATALTGKVNYVTVCATNNDSVKLPTAALGLPVEVFNLGVASCRVFPQTGGAIDALGTNNGFDIAAGASRLFWGQSATQWRSK